MLFKWSFKNQLKFLKKVFPDAIFKALCIVTYEYLLKWHFLSVHHSVDLGVTYFFYNYGLKVWTFYTLFSQFIEQI